MLDQLKPVVHHGLPTCSMESNALQVPRTKGKYGQMVYSYRGPMQWNVTSVDLKSAGNIIQLKSSAQKQLVQS